MATVTTATVRERLATSLSAGMPTGWRQSVFSPSQIGRDGGPGARVWSVEIPNTTVLPGRHRVKSGGGYTDEPWEVEDDIRVRWVVQVRADGAVADYQTGLDVDGLVLKALYTGASAFVSTNTTAPLLVDSSRTLVADGAFLLGEMRFSLRRLFGLPV